ncbi:MAG: hypothetical protein R3B60_01830 [Candidatus Paceibacterota bacterium]
MRIIYGDSGSVYIPNGDGISIVIPASCDGECGGTCGECQAKGKTA